MVWANMLIMRRIGAATSGGRNRSQTSMHLKSIISGRIRDWDDMKLISGWPIDVRPETGAPVQLITGIEVLP